MKKQRRLISLTNFSELNISESTQRALSKMGFEEATPIQEGTVRFGMEGRDVIGQAQTGTGKTAAFGIPIIEKVDTKNPAVQALVIAPTRELAIQVSEEIARIGADKRVRILSVYGGQEIGRQIRALRNNPQIIVGTPGRILDHIKRKTLKLDGVQTLILDEADEMLNMGFIEDINTILASVPSERQTLLFSATMPGPIRKIAETFMKNPEMVKIKSKEMTVENIEQFFVKAQEREKFDVLSRLLNVQQPELAIIFGRTKRRVDELSQALSIRGYIAEGIHGDLTQAKRMSVLKQFKEGKVDILVATDVAARGLDISGVTHVYNFDIPQDPESYVHRIGRTGRAGKSGVAITFVTPREMGYLRIVEEPTTGDRSAKKTSPRFIANFSSSAYETFHRMLGFKFHMQAFRGDFKVDLRHFEITVHHLFSDRIRFIVSYISLCRNINEITTVQFLMDDRMFIFIQHPFRNFNNNFFNVFICTQR